MPRPCRVKAQPLKEGKWGLTGRLKMNGLTRVKPMLKAECLDPGSVPSEEPGLLELCC